MSEDDNKPSGERLISLIIGQLANLTGQVASSAKDLAKSAVTMSSLWGDGWVRDILFKSGDPRRIRAMADAGSFLKDAREVAGLTIAEMADALGIETGFVEEVERGDKLLPFEVIFRAASLIARHDPLPFIIKFMRTYNPALEEKMEAWGLAAFPRQFERERRFVNIYRKHDALRALSDSEFDRIIGYSDNVINLALDIMLKERGVGLAQMEDLSDRHAEELAIEKEKNLALQESMAALKAESSKKRKTKAKPGARTAKKRTSATRTKRSTKAKTRSTQKRKS